jgi:hypothetical protein
VVCPKCDAKLRLREESAGRQVKCAACGKLIDVPADPRPAESSGAGDRKRPIRQAPLEQEQGNFGWLLWLLGGAAVLLAIGIAIGAVLLHKWVNAESANLPPIVKPTVYPSTEPPPKPAPILDERKSVPPGAEWSREVTSQFGGALPFRITSQGPFAVRVVTKRAYEAARNKAPVQKQDVLLTADSKDNEYEARVTLPGGKSYFIIQNKSTNAAELHLQCFPRY